MASFLASWLLFHLLHLPRVLISPLSGPSGLGRDNTYFCWLLFPLLKGGPWGFKAFLYFCAYLGATQIYRGSCFKGNIRYTRWKVRGSLQSLDLRHKSRFTITWRRQQPPLQALWVCRGASRWLQHQQLASWFQKEHREGILGYKAGQLHKISRRHAELRPVCSVRHIYKCRSFFIAFFLVCNNIFIGKFIYFLFFFLDWKNP